MAGLIARQEVSLGKNEPSPRELDVLKALWGLGSGSVREVHERMCPDGELAFNTIQTLLRIMEDKGLIRHRASGRTFIYEPIYNRDRVTARLLHQVFDGAPRSGGSQPAPGEGRVRNGVAGSGADDL